MDRANYESNDERRDELPSSRKCFNKLCTSKKIYKKIRSRVEDNKYRFFCRTCYDNYYNNLYCEFCEQIYSTNGENEDDDKWIGCDHCERWVLLVLFRTILSARGNIGTGILWS